MECWERGPTHEKVTLMCNSVGFPSYKKAQFGSLKPSVIRPYGKTEGSVLHCSVESSLLKKNKRNRQLKIDRYFNIFKLKVSLKKYGMPPKTTQANNKNLYSSTAYYIERCLKIQFHLIPIILWGRPRLQMKKLRHRVKWWNTQAHIHPSSEPKLFTTCQCLPKHGTRNPGSFSVVSGLYKKQCWIPKAKPFPSE